MLDWARSSLAYSANQSSSSAQVENLGLTEKLNALIDREGSDVAASTLGSTQHPTFGPIKAALKRDLQGCEEYVGAVWEAFNELIFHVISFCRDRLDGSPRERGRRGEYLFRPDANEWELQADLHEFLQGNFLSADIRTEVDGVGTGRADISVSMGATRFIIELKHSSSSWSRKRVRRFLAQASAYQTANARLGMLGILDTGKRKGPPPHLKENIWLEKIVPQGATLPLHIICFRVPGNLLRPSRLNIPVSDKLSVLKKRSRGAHSK